MLSTRFIPSNSIFPKAILFGYNISLSSTSYMRGNTYPGIASQRKQPRHSL